MAAWINRAESLVSWGAGWTGTGPDVTLPLAYETTVAADPNALIAHLDTTLMAGRMSAGLKRALVDAMAGVPATSATRDRDRARVALFLTLAAPEYLVQR